MKICTVCKTSKPLSEYFANKRSSDGKGYRCKHCDTNARKTSRVKSPATKEGYRRRSLMCAYGITLEEFDNMLKSQGGACRLCGTFNPLGEGNTGRVISFSVDHCHKTGRVRGLLCNPCNRGLGFLNDDPELLARAIKYLEDK